MRFARLFVVGVFCLQIALGAPKQFVSLSGDSYFDVAVTRRDPTGVGFTHRDGVAFVDFSNMSEQTKREFGFDPATYQPAFEAKQKKELAQAEKARIDAETALAAAEQKRILQQIQLDAAKRARDAALVATAPVGLPTLPAPARSIASRDYSARDYSASRVQEPVGGGRCAGTTKKGMQCKRSAAAGSAYCYQHGG